MDDPFVERQESRPDATNFKMPKKRRKIFFSKKIIKVFCCHFWIHISLHFAKASFVFSVLRVSPVAAVSV